MTRDSAPAMRSISLPAQVTGFWLFFCTIYIAIRWPEIIAFRQADPDDTLRLVQVRDLLAGQGWFDLHQYRIDPPAGIVMHWSRLVDLPLALVQIVLRPILGVSLAEQVAAVVVPLLTFGAILLSVAVLARRLVDERLVPYAAALIGASFPVAMQVMPTRVDHHGWQILAVLVAMIGQTDPNERRGGIVAGIALALGMAISLELLPVALLVGAVFAVTWLSMPDRSMPFVAYVVSLAACSIAAFALARGPDWAAYCDTVSPGYLAALVVVALGSITTARVAPRTAFAIICGLALSAGLGIAALLWLAPACASGPFPMLDPLLRTIWISNVAEGQPVLTLDAVSLVQWAVPPLIGIVAAIVLARTETRSVTWGYAAVLAGTFVMGLLLVRSMAFACALAIVPAAWLIRRVGQWLDPKPVLARTLGLAAIMIVCAAPGLPVLLAASTTGSEEETSTRESGADSDAEKAMIVLASLPAGTVLTSFDLGPKILLRTNHAVVATGHHRGAPAMHDTIVAFIVDPPVSRAIAGRHDVRYVVVDPAGLDVRSYARFNANGLAAQLIGGKHPDWLKPVAMPAGSSLAVYEVIGAR